MANNQEVAHSFAYGNDEKGSNFYSEENGTLLYSYSSLMARKFNDLILVSEDIATYSNTSQKHHSHFYRACNHWDIVYVSELDKYGKLEDFLNQQELNIVNNKLIELYNKQKRARTRDYGWEIKNQLEKGNAILEHGKIDKRSSIYKQFMNILHCNDLDTILENAEKSKKLEKQRIAKARYQRNKEYFERWTGVKCPYKPTELNDYNYLRINGDTLQTNGGVSVDLKEASILYKAYKSNKNVVGQKIGYYTILKANKNVVQIGCHNIMAKELDRVLG